MGTEIDPRHSSASNEHYTPPEIVEAARATMFNITLDPCSCSLAQTVVRAGTYFDRDGLFCDWCHDLGEPSRVLLNPPGGLLHPDTLEPLTSKKGMRPGFGGVSSAAVWWQQLINEWRAGHVNQACFVCFNLEVFRHTQNGGIPACADQFPICFLRERPRFWNESTPIGKGAPTHAGAVVYLPPIPTTQDRTDYRQRFLEAFRSLGYVRR